ncbi:MAG: DUF4373 domain-containing protein [Bacteroidetes bacterium]|nr:DUF4373 domain-containing protein [Bacteroidota bacterium]
MNFSTRLNNNMIYAPISVKCSNDPCIQEIEALFGITGFGIYIKLLLQIYQNGYFLNWTNTTLRLFCRNNGVRIKQVNDVIEQLMIGNLINREKYQNFQVLTSAEIQERFFKVMYRCDEAFIYKCLILCDKLPKNVSIINYTEPSDVNTQPVTEPSDVNTQPVTEPSDVNTQPVTELSDVNTQPVTETSSVHKLSTNLIQSNLTQSTSTESNRNKFIKERQVDKKNTVPDSSGVFNEILKNQNLSIENKLLQLNNLKKANKTNSALIIKIEIAEMTLNAEKEEKEKISAKKENE